MGTDSILAFIGGYVATAFTAFLLYSPVLVLFVLLLLMAGVLQLIALPFILLFRRLRGKGSDRRSDGTWFFH